LSEGEKLEEISVSNEEKAFVSAPLDAGFIKATPIAKKLAEENKVDLSLVTGTGPGGRITEEDVKKYIEEKNVAKEEKTKNPENETEHKTEETKRDSHGSHAQDHCTTDEEKLDGLSTSY